jgi:FKBP-type peptidyl-prolyl cis-trans isomerase
MKNKYLLSILVLVMAFAVSNTLHSQDKKEKKSKKGKKSGETEAVVLNTAADSASYAFGILYGDMFSDMNKVSPVDLKLFMTGTKQALNDEKTLLSVEDCQMFLQGYMMKMSEKMAELNKKEGEEFLAKNKENEGVKETASGLQYKVIEEGTGKSPASSDVVVCDYEGKLINGDIFDSSYERGEPAEFALDQVIPGWTEGLQLMKEGATYVFYIPPDLAYGERGPQAIGPNQTLIFKVKLLEVKEKEKQEPVQLPQLNQE